jgi:hypothetical protein
MISCSQGKFCDFPIVLYRLVAVAERGDQPQIHVFDLRSFRRKKTLVAPEPLSCKVRTLTACGPSIIQKLQGKRVLKFDNSLPFVRTILILIVWHLRATWNSGVSVSSI